VPPEVSFLSTLTELYLDDNQLQSLPVEIGHLRKLEKFLLQKNLLEELPNTVGRCCSLTVLDVSCNRLEMFPTELKQLKKLHQFHCEQNPLIPKIPIPADQLPETLSLKELAGRLLAKEVVNGNKWLNSMLAQYPEIHQALLNAGTCAVCGHPVVNSWLECVHFQPAKAVLGHLRNNPGIIPFRVTLCSYTCFNTEGHEFYGVADPSE
jgi:hypothetical protein